VTEINTLRARQEALETSTETLYEMSRVVRGNAHTALDLARQNVKLLIVLRATQLEHGRILAGLVADLAELKDCVGARGDVAGLKDDVGQIKSGLAEVIRRLPAPPE
jgi:hypothetical protein